MYAIRNGLKSTSRLSGVIARTYGNSIISAPPEVKVSNAEKIFSLFCIGGSILIAPMYFIPKFKVYANSSPK